MTKSSDIRKKWQPQAPSAGRPQPDFIWIDAAYYAISIDYNFRFFASNYWPTIISLICYAHICIDGVVRSCLQSKLR